MNNYHPAGKLRRFNYMDCFARYPFKRLTRTQQRNYQISTRIRVPKEAIAPDDHPLGCTSEEYKEIAFALSRKLMEQICIKPHYEAAFPSGFGVLIFTKFKPTDKYKRKIYKWAKLKKGEREEWENWHSHGWIMSTKWLLSYGKRRFKNKSLYFFQGNATLRERKGKLQQEDRDLFNLLTQ